MAEKAARVFVNENYIDSTQPALPSEVWNMILDYGSFTDVKNFGLVCRNFRQISLQTLNKKSKIILKLSCGKSFAKNVTRFCRQLRPIQKSGKTILRISINENGYKKITVPDEDVLQDFQEIADKLIYLRNKNECYSVRDVFSTFNIVNLTFGIGHSWQFHCFIETWNLLCSTNVKRFIVTLFLGDMVGSELSVQMINKLQKFENATSLSLLFLTGQDCKCDHIEREAVIGICSKFPKLQHLTIYPRKLSDDIAHITTQGFEHNYIATALSVE